MLSPMIATAVAEPQKYASERYTVPHVKSLMPTIARTGLERVVGMLYVIAGPRK